MNFPARAALALLLLVVLSGCSSLSPLMARITGRPAPSAPGDAGPTVPDVFTLEVDGPEPLRALLLQHLDLARFRDASTAGAVTRLELDRLIVAAPAQARALAETEGYFDAQVEVSRDRAEVPHVRVVIEPGPRVLVDALSLKVEGPLEVSRAAGDDAAQGTARALLDRWPLQPGVAFTQSAWASAKLDTLARLQGSGYPLATWRSTAAQIDPEAHTAGLDLVADSGPLFRLATVEIKGLSRYDESAARNLIDLQPGQVYSEALLADWQERLRRAEMFEGATGELQADPEHADAATVVVTLQEQMLQQANVGVGYSSETGARVTLNQIHRRVFGWNASATNKFELGSAKQSWDGQLISHPLADRKRNLLSAGVERLDQNDEVRTSAYLKAGVVQDTTNYARQYFLAVQSATVESNAPTTSATAISANYNWLRRDIDSVLLPTRGNVISTEFAAGYSFSNSETNGIFGRALGSIVGYQPLPNAWSLEWRVQAGQVFAKDEVGIPDTLLFRAGGQDSVRGYAFRSLGPVVNGVVTSGHMLFTSTLEVAHPISSRFPTLLGSFFVDAGNAANQWSQMRPVVGVGPGIRWRSPVGALRFDLAYGLDNHSWRLEVSLGIAP